MVLPRSARTIEKPGMLNFGFDFKRVSPGRTIFALKLHISSTNSCLWEKALAALTASTNFGGLSESMMMGTRVGVE